MYVNCSITSILVGSENETCIWMVVGGASVDGHHGSPGTVLVVSEVGGVRESHLWVDHAHHAWGCEKHSTYIDLTQATYLHPLRDACIRPKHVC